MREADGTLSLDLYHVVEPMRHSFGHAAAQRSASDSLVLSLTAEGICGLGECAPRAYVTGETAAGVTRAARGLDLTGLADILRGSSGRNTLGRLGEDGFETTTGIEGGNNLVCLLEMAVIDHLCRRDGLSVADALAALGCPPPSDDGAAETLPISQVLDLGLDVDVFLAERGPFHFVKIKASDDVARDVATTRAVRAALGDGVPIMIDANMSWSGDEAPRIVMRLMDAGASLFEEPVAKGDLAAAASLRRRVGARVMLDESVCSLNDAQAALAAGACDAFNIRISKCGGILRSARLIDFARQHGVAYQIGVQVAEVGPLIAASRHLAFSYGDQIILEAGQSDRFFEKMVVAPPPTVDRLRNRVARPSGFGLGMVLSDRAETHRVDGWSSTCSRILPAEVVQ